MLRPTVSRPVCTGAKPHMGPKTSVLFLSESVVSARTAQKNQLALSAAAVIMPILWHIKRRFGIRLYSCFLAIMC
jgi:hypothetical protein